MNIQTNSQKTETTALLKDVKPFEKAIRFATVTFQEAIKCDAFYMKLPSSDLKDGRSRLVNLHDGHIIERDGEHRVVQHEITCDIKQN